MDLKLLGLAMAHASLESIPVGKMARFLCLGGMYCELKLEGFLHWKKHTVENKEYALLGPILKFENAEMSD